MNDRNDPYFTHAIFAPNKPKCGETSEIGSENHSDSKDKCSVRFKEKIDYEIGTEIVTLENGLPIPAEPIKKIYFTDEILKKPSNFNNRHSVFTQISEVSFFEVGFKFTFRKKEFGHPLNCFLRVFLI